MLQGQNIMAKVNLLVIGGDKVQAFNSQATENMLFCCECGTLKRQLKGRDSGLSAAFSPTSAIMVISL